MPIYEYECTECGKIEEVWQKLSDAPITACNHCSGKLRKLVSHSSFHLKGGGWYVTDYANKSKATTPPTNNETSTKPPTSNNTSDQSAAPKTPSGPPA